MHGNRDFLIGQQFLTETGCQLLPDPSVVNIYGKNYLLMHGDTLCLDDISYLRFRHYNRKPWIQRIFLALPLFLRQSISQKIRNISQDKDTQLQDITHSEIPRIMQEYKVNTLIHGHTHRPAIHYLNLNSEQPLLRIVLSDWNEQRGNKLTITEDHTFRLSYF
jgi:UDP-2,3-diacylglucosamine hydrolase